MPLLADRREGMSCRTRCTGSIDFRALMGLGNRQRVQEGRIRTLTWSRLGLELVEAIQD